MEYSLYTNHGRKIHSRIRLLDLYCGAGGSSEGYHRAGFTHIDGVDIRPQPNYPFNFYQDDALEYLMLHGDKYDFIHASPPCQAYSKTKVLQDNNHPELVGPTRELLIASGKPYVIENVIGAPLINPITLTGSMFDLLTMRPRIFETSFYIEQPDIPPAKAKHAKMGRAPKDGEYIHVVGNFSGAEYAKRAMDIDWMVRNELAQAIPPAYTQWIAEYFFKYYS